MIFVFGGSYNGKLNYVHKTYHPRNVVDGRVLQIKDINKYDCIYNVDLLIRKLIKSKGLEDFKDEYLKLLQNKIIIGNEIGQGIVPVDPFEREWRDEVGFFYQSLSKNARTVIRVWNGIPVTLR